MWNDPGWVKWQIEHQKLGNPSAYTIWMMKKFSINININVIPAMQAFNRSTISCEEACRRLKTALECLPSMKDLNVCKT